MYGKYAAKSATKFEKEKYGNVAEINLFIIGLLRAAGIEADPVILSTRGHGKVIYQYPFSHSFNYVAILANIDGALILTDGTESLVLNNRLPVRCINDRGLIVKGKGDEWVNLTTLNPSSVITNIALKVNEEEIRAVLNRSYTEYEAFNARERFSNDPEKVSKDFLSRNYSVNDSSIAIRNYLKKDLPYQLSCEFSLTPEIIQNKIYVSPFLNEMLDDNPLKQKSRNYPIDMEYPKKKSFNVFVEIPEGYEIEYLPEDQRISNSLFEMSYKNEVGEKNIRVLFSFYFKKSVYSASDYRKIKIYFEELINKGSEKIVFSKPELVLN
jgi:hypothetical protein